MGIIDGFKKLVGASSPQEALAQENDKQIKSYLNIVDKINALEPEYEALSNEQLTSKTFAFRERLQRGASLDSLLVECFATVREASWRVLKLRHFDVQVLEFILNDI